jgi:ribosomal-protein-alanine N-acetyltransferase
MSRAVVLETARLVLRPISTADAPAHFEIKKRIAENRESSGFLLGARFASIADVEARLAAHLENPSICAWTIVRSDGDVSVGIVAFIRWDAASSRSEVSYEIDPLFWANGYAREALERMISFGFEDLALHRIEAWIDTRNTRSCGVAERAGFMKEGVLREHTLAYGVFADIAVYAKLKAGT